jgi:Ser/Thr protein kinase RdoA (MazF antagonist)
LGELAFVRYLAAQGAGVADVINSRQGRLLEEIYYGNQRFFVSVFERAKGEQLADRGYRYREGVPLTEYFYNIGKTLGKIHAFSKKYTPVHPRYSFFDKYTPEFIRRIIPDSLPELKGKLLEILQTLAGMERTPETFGLVHFDYSDGNYMIDYATGDLTVFDFDNACTCWYLVDLANVWAHGVGWIQFEADTEERQGFMSKYFATVLEGYWSETDISEEMLEHLPLFIQVTVMESVIDAFEVMRNNGEPLECDEDLAYLIKCIEDDIPFMGFFDEIYNCDEPFEYEAPQF